jgi:HTH-type transcriptional regulator/antitoxin HigA
METAMKALTPDIDKALKAWPALASVLSVPKHEAQYRQLVKLLDYLIDEVGENQSHPLASLMDLIGVLIEKYEDEHVPALEPR